MSNGDKGQWDAALAAADVWRVRDELRARLGREPSIRAVTGALQGKWSVASVRHVLNNPRKP